MGLYYTVAEIDMYGDTTGFQLETSSPLGYVIVKEKNINTDLNMTIIILINVNVYFSPQPHTSKWKRLHSKFIFALHSLHSTHYCFYIDIHGLIWKMAITFNISTSAEAFIMWALFTNL